MSAQIHTSQKNTVVGPRFTPLDVVGVSVSTLLFTIVWVAVFSVFLPEKSSLVLSSGFQKANQSEVSDELTMLNQTLRIAQKHITAGVHGGIVSLLSVIQTGGSAQGMVVAFGQTVSADTVSRPLARVFTNTAVLGAATSEAVADSAVQAVILDQSYTYFNTVSFGLLDQIDKHFELAMDVQDVS